MSLTKLVKVARVVIQAMNDEGKTVTWRENLGIDGKIHKHDNRSESERRNDV